MRSPDVFQMRQAETVQAEEQVDAEDGMNDSLHLISAIVIVVIPVGLICLFVAEALSNGFAKALGKRPQDGILRNDWLRTPREHASPLILPGYIPKPFEKSIASQVLQPDCDEGPLLYDVDIPDLDMPISVGSRPRSPDLIGCFLLHGSRVSIDSNVNCFDMLYVDNLLHACLDHIEVLPPEMNLERAMVTGYEIISGRIMVPRFMIPASLIDDNTRWKSFSVVAVPNEFLTDERGDLSIIAMPVMRYAGIIPIRHGMCSILFWSGRSFRIPIRKVI